MNCRSIGIAGNLDTNPPRVIRRSAMDDILTRLSKGVVLGDGGYIIELERRGYVVAGAFTPELAITHPDAIREMHREFLNAGSDVVQVMAFYGSREKLATVGKA